MIRLATADDAKALGVIGPAVYAEAYANLWTNSYDYAVHLESFGQQAFEQILAAPNTYIWVAELDERLIGFLSMIIGSPDPILHCANGAEIPRIYILSAAQRCGIGQRLYNSALAKAKSLGCEYLWLDVRMSADWAQNAYKKWGFSQIGSMKSLTRVDEKYRELAIMRKNIS